MLAHLARHGTCPVAAPCPVGVPHYITQIIAHQEMGIFTCSCVQGVLFSALTIQQQPGDAKPKKETFLLRVVLTLWKGWEGETGEPEICEVEWRKGPFS